MQQLDNYPQTYNEYQHMWGYKEWPAANLYYLYNKMAQGHIYSLVPSCCTDSISCLQAILCTPTCVDTHCKSVQLPFNAQQICVHALRVFMMSAA